MQPEISHESTSGMTGTSGQEAAITGPAAVLAVQSRAMTCAEAAAMVHRHYGFAATATPLRSERDQNFLMTDIDGRRSVLKLGNALQDARLCGFQIRALMHIAAVDPGLPVPRVIPTADGASQVRWDDGEAGHRTGYLLEFLAGVPIAELPQTSALVAEAGTMAARLGRALRGFFDPAAGHELLWDLKQAPHLAGILPHIRSDHDRDLAAAALDRFRRHAAPRLLSLRGQVIHNDLNPYNILADPAHPERPNGIIDFGDMVFGALINDVAVAAAYLIRPAEDPFSLLTAFVGAYHATTPLEPEEIDLLPDLIATRHAMTAAITGWRAERYPDNAPYILRNAQAAFLGLQALSGPGRAALAQRLAAACAAPASA